MSNSRSGYEQMTEDVSKTEDVDSDEDTEEDAAAEEAARKAALEAFRELLSEHGFIKEHILGEGLTGVVSSFEYDGDDQEIEKLQDRDKILVKYERFTADTTQDSTNLLMTQARMSFAHEWKIIGYVNSQKENVKDVDEYLPRVAALEFNGVKVILNQPVFYDENPKNLDNYMRTLGTSHSILQGESKTVEANSGDFINKFDKIFSSYYDSLAKLHECNLIHLDVAPRNVALSEEGAKVIDLGGSIPCDLEGKSTSFVDFPFFPRCSYNQETLLRIQEAKNNKNSSKDVPGVYTVKTDLFAFRVCLIESLAGYAGIPTHRINDDIHKKGGATNLHDMSDQDRILLSIKNLENVAKKLAEKNDLRGERILQVVEKYRDYLTNVPKPESSVGLEISVDRRAFVKCNSSVVNVQVEDLNQTPKLRR